MIEFLNFMFSGDTDRVITCFTMFCIMIYAPISFLKFCWRYFLRYLNIRKHGYPPVHCDADGDTIENGNP
ncbi:hypothetical protein CLU81_3579 [Flavobacterium sp. 9]|nr:hypothetical protein CLU81_3579 [Flavobacterium sp. 9]